MNARSTWSGVLVALATMLGACVVGVPPALAATADVVRVASLGPAGSNEMAISHDGRYIAFVTNDPARVHVAGESEIFVYDRAMGAITFVAAGNNPSMSGDGRYLAFEAGRSVYWHDMHTATTQLVSTGVSDLDDPATQAFHYGKGATISGNGRYVAFWSFAQGQPDFILGVYVRDVVTAKTREVDSSDNEFGSFGLALNDDGRFLAVSQADARVLDLVNGSAIIARRNTPEGSGVAPPNALSADARFFTYTYRERDRDAHYVQRVVRFDTRTRAARTLPVTALLAASSDGRYVADSTRVFDTRTGASLPIGGTCGSLGTPGAIDGGTVAFSAPGPDGPMWLFTAPVRGAEARPYRLVASDGGVFTYGGAKFYGSTGNIALREPVVGTASALDGRGYWLVASDGGVFSFGSATFYGSLGALHLRSPIVGMARALDGRGYWLVASDGGVFAFGSARFFGSLGALHVTSPVAGMAAALDGRGYWLVARDGGVFAFGSARYHGSAFGRIGTAHAVGIAASLVNDGYFVATDDGNVFAQHTTTLGSLPALHVRPAAPVVAIAATAGVCGYRLAGADGGVFPFGGAGLEGSAATMPLRAPIVAIG